LLIICLLVAEATVLRAAADDLTTREQNSAAQALHELFDSEWQRTLRESPTHASQLGDRRYNRLWSDVSEKAIEMSAAKTRKALATLVQIDFNQLSQADRLNYQLFKREYETRIAIQPLQLHFMPLNQRGGIQNENDLARLLSFDSVTDYDDWIARLNAFPLYMDQTIALMRSGMATGMLHPKVVMKRVPAQIRTQLVKNAEDS
ncbi:MAG: DUF885 domain-containing protein, partial [Fuerstiella sp.]|nr:DUF885 domain-containing protein [Fuerstiella sp.]